MQGKYLCPKCGVEMEYYRVSGDGKIVEYYRCPRCGLKIVVREIQIEKDDDIIIRVKKHNVETKKYLLGEALLPHSLEDD